MCNSVPPKSAKHVDREPLHAPPQPHKSTARFTNRDVVFRERRVHYMYMLYKYLCGAFSVRGRPPPLQAPLRSYNSPFADHLRRVGGQFKFNSMADCPGINLKSTVTFRAVDFYDCLPSGLAQYPRHVVHREGADHTCTVRIPDVPRPYTYMRVKTPRDVQTDKLHTSIL